MVKKSGISWTQVTHNTCYGCKLASPGCRFCYAMARAREIETDERETRSHNYDGLTRVVNGRPMWTGEIRTAGRDHIRKPISWRKPQMIFISSMSDLFYDGVPKEHVFEVFDMMMEARHHVMQLTTKRSERMRDLALEYAQKNGIEKYEHIWFGASVEDEDHIDRLMYLNEIPASVRWVSFEPLLEPISEGYFHYLDGVDFIVVGGESMDRSVAEAGFTAREFDVDWARPLLDFSRETGKRFHFKQTGSNPVGLTQRAPRGDDINEWPADLRVQEFPDLPEPAQKSLF